MDTTLRFYSKDLNNNFLSRFFKRFFFSSTKKNNTPPLLTSLEKTLHYKINNHKLFELALTHRSIHTKTKSVKSLNTNERLEFLGDSVLNLFAAQYLYKNFPEANEGFLTVERSKLVNKTALIKYAEKLNLSKFIQTHSGFSSVNQKGVNTVIANAFEAIVAAIYIDGGERCAKIFVEQFFDSLTSSRHFKEHSYNYKGMLLEILQSKKMGQPVYNVLKTEGPEHRKIFYVDVTLDNISQGAGTGSSKKEAEQNAAKEAYNRLSKKLK